MPGSDESSNDVRNKHPLLGIRIVPLPAMIVCALLAVQLSGASEQERRILTDAIRPVTAESASGAKIVRTELTEAQLESPITVSVSLSMRNSRDFQARLARGENLRNGGLSRTEMEDHYLPAAADYSAVRAWLMSEGLEIVLDDENHTTVFAKGTVSRISKAFQVSFARVETAEGEFTSAVTAPSLPEFLPASVLTIDGLQTHIRAHAPPASRSNGSRSTGIYVAPSDIMAAYAVPSSLTGRGQTIAIIMGATLSDSDLEQFWTTANVAQSISNVTTIEINGGPGSGEQSTAALEVAIDVEWASATAPGAKVRLYAVSDLTFNTINLAALQVLQDAGTNPNLSVLSMSIAGPEDQLSPGNYQAYSQTFEQLAAAGITTLACTGDSGSNPNPNLSNDYDPSFALSVEYPASDPNVIGVGGTNLTFSDSWTFVGEVAWSTISSQGAGTDGTPMASGGGVSIFPRPSWQFDGGSVLASNSGQRCVPDVAAISMATTMSTNPSSTTYAAIVLNGSISGCYGTSLATPIWAGIVALINQGRALSGLGPIGLLGPALYPLHGTEAFNDITSGSNGRYTAGPGYDLCTGLGTPNVASLVAALSGQTSAGAPVGTITGLAPSAPVEAGSRLVLAASSAVPVSFQWYLNGTAIAGATSASYAIIAGAEDSGTYSVTLTAIGGTATLGAGSVSIATNAWLTNLAARAYVEKGANPLIAGLVTTGPSQKTILVRGDGPSLADFSIPGFLTTPQLSLVNSGGTILASNSGWDSSLATVFDSLGAYPFPAGSNDTAILYTIPSGAFTALVSSGIAENGVGEVEVYDADASAPTSRLVNLSARAFVGTGANILIGGFVIAGTTSETVIVRGVGPGLSQFGLTGLLSNPVLSIFDQSGTMIARNIEWGNPVASNGAATENATAAEFTRVQAFALAAGSTDSAMILTLPPGNYTAQLSGAAGSVSPTGTGLVEIYEMR